jgi:hypothetical protein
LKVGRGRGERRGEEEQEKNFILALEWAYERAVSHFAVMRGKSEEEVNTLRQTEGNYKKSLGYQCQHCLPI